MTGDCMVQLPANFVLSNVWKQDPEVNHKKYLEKIPVSQLWFTLAKAHEWLLKYQNSYALLPS